MNAMKQNGSESIKVTVSNTVARDNICSLAGERARWQAFLSFSACAPPHGAPPPFAPAVALAPPGCRLS